MSNSFARMRAVAALLPLLLLPSMASAQATASKPQHKPEKRQKKSTLPTAYRLRHVPLEARTLAVKDSFKSVFLGLRWLRKHQDPKGFWDCDEFMKLDEKGDPCDGPGTRVHDVGVTGLALLAFLADGHSELHGAHSKVVKSGIRWLRDQQDRDTGIIGGTAHHMYIYQHAIATQALCEAYGLSKSGAIKEAAQAALGYLEKHRNPFKVWRYMPRDGDNDLSVTSWAASACCAGRDFGLDVEDQLFKDVAKYVDSMTDAAGMCGYVRRGGMSARMPGAHSTKFPPGKTQPMTAAGLFLRFRLGQDPKEREEIGLAVESLQEKFLPRATKDGSIDYYYWYYGSLAMQQHGGQAWKEWCKALESAVVKTQRQDGNFKGSWDPDGVWGKEGGRVYSTAMALLALEAQFRYAPRTTKKK